MKKGNVKILLLEILLIVLLFFALFASKITTRYALAGGLLVLVIFLYRRYRIKDNNYIYSKQVNILLILFGIIYVAVFYAMGLHFGFIHSKYDFSWFVIWRFIIPFTSIIICSEYLRKILLSQDARIEIKGRKFDLSLGFTFIIMVLIDLVIYTGIYDLYHLEDFLMALGFVLFASVSCNLLYQYVTKRFGFKGIIFYRLITSLFIYIIPIIPDVYVFFKSFLRMIYPFIIYLILENTYAKSNLAVGYRTRKKNIVSTTIALAVTAGLVMLISCQFRFGIVVIGSESMTGTLNVGDAIIYERYDGGQIQNGQIVIFDTKGFKTIHRIIKISNIDGETRYITKGDANKEQDKDYITKKDIVGLVKLRVKYIGWPTLWLRKLFK
jgi:signal peptidase I